MKAKLLLLASLILIYSVSPATMVLTIDTGSETYTWSGTATTDLITLSPVEGMTLLVGTALWGGGEGASEGTTSLSATASGSPSIFQNSLSATLIVNSAQASAYSAVIDLFNSDFEAPQSATVEVSGDGNAYSYASLSESNKASLAGMDGVGLTFYHQVEYTTYGTAGSVVVVPEPSHFALGGAFAALAIGLWRRRTAVKRAA